MMMEKEMNLEKYKQRHSTEETAQKGNKTKKRQNRDKKSPK